MATVTAQRKCSMCRQPGHTKRTCPQRTVLPRPAKPAAPAAPVPSQPIEAEKCPICMEPLGNATTCTTPCGHGFCMQCLLRHQQTRSDCPLCRAVLPGVAAPPAPPPAQRPVPPVRGYAATLALRAAPSTCRSSRSGSWSTARRTTR